MEITEQKYQQFVTLARLRELRIGDTEVTGHNNSGPFNQYGTPLAYCKHCAKPTLSLSTELCDSCWNLTMAIRSNVDIAIAILKEVTS